MHNTFIDEDSIGTTLKLINMNKTNLINSSEKSNLI